MACVGHKGPALDFIKLLRMVHNLKLMNCVFSGMFHLVCIYIYIYIYILCAYFFILLTCYIVYSFVFLFTEFIGVALVN